MNALDVVARGLGRRAAIFEVLAGSIAGASMIGTSDGATAQDAFDRLTFGSTQSLLGSTQLPRGAGTVWRAGQHTYLEADPFALDHDITTAGGVKLYAPANLEAVLPLGNGSENAQPALAALLARHPQVDLGEKRYALHGRLDMPDGTHLTGKAELTASAAIDTDVIRVGAGGSVQDIKLNANGARHGVRLNGAGASATGISVSNALNYGIDVIASQTKVRECAVYDSGWGGIEVRAFAGDIEDVEIVGNSVNRTGIAASSIIDACIKTASSGGFKVRRLFISNNLTELPLGTPSKVGCGIEVWGGAELVTVTTNITEGGSTGVSLNAVTDGTVSGNVCNNAGTFGIETANSFNVTKAGNVVNGRGITFAGLAFNAQSPGGVGNSSAVGNIVTGARTYGVGATLGTQIKIVDNQIAVQGANSVGVYMHNSDMWTIDANRIAGDGTSSTLAIWLDDSPEGEVTGNKAHDFTNRFLQFYSAKSLAYTFVKVTGNDARNCGGMFQLSGATLSTGCVFKDNRLDGHDVGYRTVSSSATLSPWDSVIDYAGDANGTITLAAGTAKGQMQRVRKTTGTALVTVLAASGNIENKSSVVLPNNWDQVAAEWNGSQWATTTAMPAYRGSLSAVPDASGDITVAHNMGGSPSQVVVTPTGTDLFVLPQVHTKALATFKVRCFDAAGEPITDSTVTADWTAFR